jgi:hypothetical protein
MIFMNPWFLNSRATGPKIRVPIGSPAAEEHDGGILVKLHPGIIHSLHFFGS